MNYNRIELIIKSLEVVSQLDGLGFTDGEIDLAIETIAILEEQPDELSFDE